MKFCVHTLGCKVNQSETRELENILAARGHTLAEPGQGCDVCVINTCAVTDESARKSRQAIRRIKKLESRALVAVCGCLSALEPAAIAELGADIVGGPGDKSELVQKIESAVRDSDGAQTTDKGQSPGAKTRALLKIQDGCDNFCAYCVIPFARGRSQSVPIEHAVEQAKRFSDDGVKEIVVTGIEIASYHDEKSGLRLVDAICAVGGAVPETRLRIGSLDPCAVNENFCAGLVGVNVCDHFHLSLQSGCDDTLRRMKRKYDVAAVQGAIAMLRERFPNCGITADLITGFPGETDDEFEKTLEFIRSAKFSDMHIFPFSPRRGTAAFDMPGGVNKAVRRERAQEAMRVARRNALKFKLSQIGKTVEVLFERERNGFWAGHSGNYLEVCVKNGGGRNSIHKVLITAAENEFVRGEIVTI